MFSNPSALLKHTILMCRKACLYALVFSFVNNLLMLAMPIYTLQVMDRVISSGSRETLVMLSVIVLATFVCLGILQVVRSYIFLGISNYFDKELTPLLLRESIHSCSVKKDGSKSQGVRDLAIIKNFITNQGIGVMFDLPWVIIYLAAIFFIHPFNAYIAIAGSVILFLAALLNELLTVRPLKEANDKYVKSMCEVEGATHNADVVEAMGMKSTIIKNWQENNDSTLDLQNYATKRSIVISNFSQIVRLITQMSMLSVGAYLVLENQMSLGGIVATSILAGKALAPFNVAITTWHNFINVRHSYHRIKHSVNEMEIRSQQMDMPEPKGHISIEKVYYQPPEAHEPIIKGISCEVEAGEVIGIIGPSGAGKTTFGRLLVGVLKPTAGAVRLDSVDIYDWGRDYIQDYIGYLPQDVHLFDGTVKDNIARMDKNVNIQQVIEAAQNADSHDAILHLEKGYNTEIGREGIVLSGGMRQRIALTRAIFGHPKVVVLDEPHSNLDYLGDLSFLKSIKLIKEKGVTLFIITHHPAILSHVDKIMVISEGHITDFDSRYLIMKKFSGKMHSPTKSEGGIK